MVNKYVTVKLPIDIGTTEFGEKFDLLMEFVAKSHDLVIKRLGEIETMVYTNAEELRNDINDATNDLAQRWESQVEALKADLAEALAADDDVSDDTAEKVNAAVAETLAKFSDLPSALRAIGRDAENPVPPLDPAGDPVVAPGEDSGAPLDQGTDTDSTGGQTSGEISDEDVTVDSPPADEPLSTPESRLNP